LNGRSAYILDRLDNMMCVCWEFGKVYQQNISYESATGGCQNLKNPKTVNAYNSLTLKYKLMRFGMLRDDNVVYLLIPSSFQ